MKRIRVATREVGAYTRIKRVDPHGLSIFAIELRREMSKVSDAARNSRVEKSLWLRSAGGTNCSGISDLQIQCFLTVTASGGVQGQQCTLLGFHPRIEQGADFLTAPDRKQLAAHLRLDDFLIEPGPLQLPGVNELQRRPGSQVVPRASFGSLSRNSMKVRTEASPAAPAA